jgi:hypothetical protein
MNHEQFDAAEKRWKSRGWDVISPPKMDLEDGTCDPTTRETTEPMDYYIKRDIEALMALDPKEDMLVLLPGWETSVGATAERAIAKWRGVAVVIDDTKELP